MIQVRLTPEQFAAKAAQLEQNRGIALAGHEGKISRMGVTASYKYADGLLTVDVLEKPFFVTQEYCEEQLSKALGV